MKLAAGRKVRHRSKDTGRVLYTEFEADPATARHYIDKILPAKQDVDVNLSGSVVINTNVKPDLGPPPKKR